MSVQVKSKIGYLSSSLASRYFIEI